MLNALVDLVIQLGPTVTQIGCGVAAWRLANALRQRVDDHERRITVLELVR